MTGYRHIISLVFFGLALLMAAGPAMAQTIPGAQQNATSDPDANVPNLQAVFDQLPKDMQDELLKEMDQVHLNCSRNELFSAYQDCDCMATKYLDARLLGGPELNMVDLMNDIGKECPNTPAIAGKMFDECNMLPNVYALTDKEREEFCTCFANKVANDYTRRPINSYHYHISLRRGAMKSCGWANVMKRGAEIRRKNRESEYMEGQPIQ